ncbi:hypothetical protein F8M49_21515 [Rhodococcus zopfii]|uniref:Uncharacterized protein n=1 Tax=Rhodococcus zopfii TaxID=43772 RepID=A0ABU3WTG6_9NOCA|nr:hypothetical protein [Rhodococcus zopfii]
MTDYTVHITRADADDRAWTVEVSERPDWTFREKSFTAVDARVRDLARTHDGADPAAVTITRARVRVGDVDVTDQLADLDALRRRAQETAKAIGARTVDLVATLRGQAGLTTRDTGSVLGLTGSRVNQLENAPKAEQESDR